MSKPTERGQALILIALAAVGLFAFSALAIDGSRAFSDKRHAQNAADTAVMTAALKYIRTNGSFTDAETEAMARAVSNGYTNNWDTTIVDVDQCDDVVDINPLTGAPVPGDVDPNTGNAIPCEGIVAGHESEYLRVKIISIIPTTFGRVIGRQTLTSAVEAIARVQGSGSSSTYPDNAIVALKQTDCAVCSGGNQQLYVHGSGVFSNSTADCIPPGRGSIDIVGNGTFEADGGFITPTGTGMCFNPYIVGVSGSLTAGTQITSFNINVPKPSITCTGPLDPPSHMDATGAEVFPPGHYTKIELNNTGVKKLEHGNYCLDQGLHMTGNPQVFFTNVNIQLNGGEFKIEGTGSLTCNRLLVYGAPGSAGVRLAANTNINCSGVTFYVESGEVHLSGNTGSNLSAPTTDPYKGLLVYVPASSGATVSILGNSDNRLTGSIIAPGSQIKLSGNSGSTGYNTQLIGDTVHLEGGSKTWINYDPNDQYQPPSSPTIEFTK